MGIKAYAHFSFPVVIYTFFEIFESEEFRKKPSV